MMRLLTLIPALCLALMASAQQKIFITIGDRTMTATLADNKSAVEFTEYLRNTGSLSIDMQDYGGFEKVGDLPRTFVRSDIPTSTVPGDIILYQGDKFVIYYGTNSWTFTRLGKLDSGETSEIRSFLNAGGGDIKAVVSLDDNARIDNVGTDTSRSKDIYDIQGRKVRNPGKGIFIVNNKKTIIR